MKTLIFASMTLALAASCGAGKRHDATSSGASEPVARTDTETVLRHTAALDSRSPGPEWIWISPASPPTTATDKIRSVAYYQPDSGAFIQALVMDWASGGPEQEAVKSLASFKETYPDGAFSSISIVRGGSAARFSFTHHSGHAEGVPGGCATEMAFLRAPGVDGLVRLSVEGPIDRQASAATAFDAVLDTLEAKKLP